MEWVYIVGFLVFVMNYRIGNCVDLCVEGMFLGFVVVCCSWFVLGWGYC